MHLLELVISASPAVPPAHPVPHADGPAGARPLLSPPAAPAPLPPGGFVRVPLARFVPWGAVTALRLWGCGASTAMGTGAGMSSSPSSPRVVAGGTERAANIRLL